MDVNQIKRGMTARVTNLGTTDGMTIAYKHLAVRQAGKVGMVRSWVPGRGGDVWFVNHGFGEIGAYCYEELEPIGWRVFWLRWLRQLFARPIKQLFFTGDLIRQNCGSRQGNLVFWCPLFAVLVGDAVYIVKPFRLSKVPSFLFGDEIDLFAPLARLFCRAWDHQWTDARDSDAVICSRCGARMTECDNERGWFLKPWLQNLGERITALGRGDLGPSLAARNEPETMRLVAAVPRIDIFSKPREFRSLPNREIEFMRHGGQVWCRTSDHSATKASAPGAGNIAEIAADEIVFVDPLDLPSDGKPETT